MHTNAFKRIIYAYSIIQGKIADLANSVKEMELSEGYPDAPSLTGEHTLLVLDDMMLELRNDVRLAELSTKMRHCNVSTIFITQKICTLEHNTQQPFREMRITLCFFLTQGQFDD